MSSFWLREEGERESKGDNMGREIREGGRQRLGLKQNPVLGLNFDEGNNGTSCMVGNQSMNGEESPIVGERKKTSKEIENHKLDSLVVREDRSVGNTLYIEGCQRAILSIIMKYQVGTFMVQVGHKLLGDSDIC